MAPSFLLELLQSPLTSRRSTDALTHFPLPGPFDSAASQVSSPIDRITGLLLRTGAPLGGSPPSAPSGPLTPSPLAEALNLPRLSEPYLDTDFFYASAPLAPVAAAVAPVPPSPLLVKGLNSNLSFNLSWDSSVAAAPANFTSLIGSVAQFLANSLTSLGPVILNLKVGWGTLNGAALPTGALGASSNYLYSYGSSAAAYSTFRSKLVAASSGSVIDKQVLAGAVPSASPVGTASIYLSSSQAKALKVISGTQTSLDGFVGFAATNYLQTSSAGYDLIGVAQHEFTEAMGRIMLSGAKIGTATVPGYTSEDLMHFTAPGVRTLTTKGGYLSADGVNKLAYLNAQPSGDAADYATPTSATANLGTDALNAFASPGSTSFSSSDLFTMDALGWNFAPGSGLTTLSTPTYLA
jgi:hypothetical protein